MIPALIEPIVAAGILVATTLAIIKAILKS